MDAFSKQLIGRLPLACATLELFDFAFDRQLIGGIYEDHRGRCYTDLLNFPKLLELVRDCLLQHGGSGHRLFLELERDGAEPVDESNFYRKLARMPVAVSRALLRECTARLTQLVTLRAVLLPGCFEAFAVVVIDGKKVKNASARLKPTRPYSGALLAAKALVAMDARSGLALAMSDSLDGEANDVPLVGELLPQVREVVRQAILWLADRQFGDPRTLKKLAERQGDHFAVRVRQGLSFTVESQQTVADDQGRTVIDQAGLFGKGKAAMRLRRITLVRPGEEDVVLLTDLMDQAEFGALDLLKLYRKRWGIEQMFQQVTETFSLEHLIGCSPRAVLFQFAFCLLMYNLVQAVKGFVAADGKVEASVVSTYGLFYDIKRELCAWAYLGEGELRRAPRDAAAMGQRLRELLKGSWDPVAYTKASDKKPRGRPPQRQPLHGGHSSVQRLLDGNVKVKQNAATK
jgi:hypothetical protein